MTPLGKERDTSPGGSNLIWDKYQLTKKGLMFKGSGWAIDECKPHNLWSAIIIF